MRVCILFFSPAVAAAGGGQQVPKRSEIFSASSNSTGRGHAVLALLVLLKNE